MKFSSRTLTLVCSMILASGCSEVISPDSAPPDGDDDPEVAMAADLDRARPVTVTDVNLDAALADLCSVRSSFEVDPTHDEPVATATLHALASCLSDGPLKGRSLELVAHTSARNDSAYARRLGESRADSLRALLIESGAPSDDLRSNAAVAGDERSVEVRIVPRYAN